MSWRSGSSGEVTGVMPYPPGRRIKSLDHKTTTDTERAILRERERFFLIGTHVRRRGWGDDASALQDPADRDRELVGGAILDQERRGARLHRSPQVAGPAEGREDDGLAHGQMAAELPGRPEAVHPGHLDVEQGDVGPHLQSLLDDPGPRGHLGQ